MFMKNIVEKNDIPKMVSHQPKVNDERKNRH
jgi:hypothetical protein